MWNKETSRGIPRFLTRKYKFERHSKFLYVHDSLRHIKTKWGKKMIKIKLEKHPEEEGRPCIKIRVTSDLLPKIMQVII